MAFDSMSTNSVALPESVSTEIWAKTQEQSIVMQLASRITLPGNGLTIPVITGDPSADWVAETNEKPVGTHTLTTKHMKGYTIALIEPFSNQFRNNDAALYDALTVRLPGSISKVFDQTCFGFRAAPGDGFDTLAGCPTVDVSGAKTYDAFVDAIQSVADNDASLSAWALAPKARTILLKAKDSQARPLFISNAALDSAPNSVLSIPAYFRKAAYRAAVTGENPSPEVVGFAGDWSGARYGVVNDISIAMSDQASLTVQDGNATTQLNLWQRNMFAVRVELEVGFIVRDKAEFVQLNNGANA